MSAPRFRTIDGLSIRFAKSEPRNADAADQRWPSFCLIEWAALAVRAPAGYTARPKWRA
jgi:hypothetical protein